MTPEACPECDMVAYRHGLCSHCGFEDEPVSQSRRDVIGRRWIAVTRKKLDPLGHLEEPEDDR